MLCIVTVFVNASRLLFVMTIKFCYKKIRLMPSANRTGIFSIVTEIAAEKEFNLAVSHGEKYQVMAYYMIHIMAESDAIKMQFV